MTTTKDNGFKRAYNHAMGIARAYLDLARDLAPIDIDGSRHVAAVAADYLEAAGRIKVAAYLRDISVEVAA